MYKPINFMKYIEKLIKNRVLILKSLIELHRTNEISNKQFDKVVRHLGNLSELNIYGGF